MIVYPIRHGSYPELSSFQTAVLSDFLSSAFRKALPLRLQEIYNRRSETRSLFVSVKNQSTENVVKSKASTKKQPRLEEDSSTVTYLINSCGLSPESAILASQKVQFQNLVKPESVLALLSDFGFSKTQISSIVRKRPLLLLADPVNTLLPKLEFLRSIGISKSDLARTLSADATLLTRSLENQIIPSYNFLKSVLLTDERIVSSMKRTTWIFLEDPSKNLVPNITRLSELGVPQSCIILLLTHFPEAVMQKHEQFSKIVDEVKEMGFDVKKTTFVLAVHALSGKGNKSTWERCYEVYKRWGWSHDMILEAFRKHPHCMMLSEGKIMKGMDFLVNKMGYPSQVIAQFPMGLFFSLERRIIPRCRVIQVLSSKRLIKDGLSLASFLVPVEKCFLERFVNKYYAEIPQLLSVYEGKLNPEDV
ncbi:Mitochondrial transcription termination factor family protein [Tripterygium wilfordii]|uniref:Mitochondrial transcription termination factor family protein n=1 Tax=Tripterygium wilfordii TaxID=458696 RepID=A0A7J7CBE9_TRIWF|nr:transcription termination factor MTERF8, chloroplastic-like isoform X1 [Tripterygium wilfordii]KAF5731468.1 Mitochondrial transcription termination factor family protein [Tripterygium wilfordii]